ncbi:catechol 2,3-dioxygenase-like lactoylglutathione lyase family enzyme [Sphingomonas zeicaulis]|uniref:VOC family protein n=1 Tax=Sphingomonas zeicaulis TaxID=1632740 RepID=UPI003D210A8E
MIHHVSVGTNDLERSRRFYDPVLKTIGLAFMAADAEGIGWGSGQMTFSVQVPVNGEPATVGNGSHICFTAESRAMVDRFHATALENGGSSDGEPGIRAQYDDHYYGAFVRDPDGNKIEAVTYSAK